jgi:hypothetical protein
LIELLELALSNAPSEEVAFPVFSTQDGKISVSETSSAGNIKLWIKSGNSAVLMYEYNVLLS